jgi:hypothetical protein
MTTRPQAVAERTGAPYDYLIKFWSFALMLATVIRCWKSVTEEKAPYPKSVPVEKRAGRKACRSKSVPGEKRPRRKAEKEARFC